MLRRTTLGPAGAFSKGPLVQSPPWKGKLDFRKAEPADAERLKRLYDSSWGTGLSISARQLRMQMGNFPEGQIVGFEKGSTEPASMINMMLSAYSPSEGFMGGYSAVTGRRTFSTHMPPESLASFVWNRSGVLPIAYCVSIAVSPEYARNGYAKETLEYAIRFAQANGIIAVPYSAPRGFARARRACPELDVGTYLHMTRPSGSGHETLIERTRWLNSLPRVSAAFRNGNGLIREPTREIFEQYNAMGDDPPDGSRLAFDAFIDREGKRFTQIYGRTMTIEDFCLLSGRRLADPVMRMHVENGARFIRDGGGWISGVFSGSRPRDRAACGYNVVLTYGYHRLFGHDWAC